DFAPLPVALYGAVLWLDGFAYHILVRSLVAVHGQDSELAVALGADVKGMVSLVLITIAILFTFVHSWLAFGLLVVNAVIWFIPPRRIEKKLDDKARL